MEVLSDRQERGPNYILESVRVTGGNVRLEVKLASYGQILRSCDYLIEETLIAAGILKGIEGAAPLALSPARWRWVLPRRNEVFRAGKGAEDLLLSPRGRDAGIGVAGLVTWRDQSGMDHFIFKRRSGSVGTYPYMYHCVPTGMFNGKFERTDFFPNDLRYHAARVLMTEFFEELYSRRQLENSAEDPAWKLKLKECIREFCRSPEKFFRDSVDLKNGPSPGPRTDQGTPSASPEGGPDGEGPSRADGVRLALMGVIYDVLSSRPEMAFVVRLPSDQDERQFLPNSECYEEVGLYTVPGETYSPYADGPAHYHWVRSGHAVYMTGRDMVKNGQCNWVEIAEALGFELPEDAGARA